MSSTIADAARRERLRRLYDENYVAILGFALRRASPEDAADVVAETFFVAWRRLDDVPEDEQARLWLYGTARRVLANQARAARRQERLADRLRGETRPEARIDQVENRAPGAIAAAFQRLSEEDRELLSLVAWEGLDAGQAARVFGCSRNAVRIRLFRARRKLAGELGRGETRSQLTHSAHLADPRETSA
jgi:RNA polymerase sigma factor (sigma-70 family)